MISREDRSPEWYDDELVRLRRESSLHEISHRAWTFLYTHLCYSLAPHEHVYWVNIHHRANEAKKNPLDRIVAALSWTDSD